MKPYIFAVSIATLLILISHFTNKPLQLINSLVGILFFYIVIAINIFKAKRFVYALEECIEEGDKVAKKIGERLLSDPVLHKRIPELIISVIISIIAAGGGFFIEGLAVLGWTAALASMFLSDIVTSRIVDLTTNE